MMNLDVRAKLCMALYERPQLCPTATGERLVLLKLTPIVIPARCSVCVLQRHLRLQINYLDALRYFRQSLGSHRCRIHTSFAGLLWITARGRRTQLLFTMPGLLGWIRVGAAHVFRNLRRTMLCQWQKNLYSIGCLLYCPTFSINIRWQ